VTWTRWRPPVADGTQPVHSVIRIVEVNGDRRSRAIGHTKDELRSAWSAPEAGRVLELERVHQVITNWYVFASYGRCLRCRAAGSCARPRVSSRSAPDGKFTGELSYSMETEA